MAIKTRQQLADQDENVLIKSGEAGNISALDHRTSNIDHTDSTVNMLDDGLSVQTDLSNRKRLGASNDFDHTQGNGGTFVTYDEAQAIASANGGVVDSVNGVLPDINKDITLAPVLSSPNTNATSKLILLQLGNQSDTISLVSSTTLLAGLQSATDKAKSDKYPSTATTGKYLQGDGTNYVEVDIPAGGGIPEAPNDGFPYVRQSLGWVQGVLKSTYDAFVSATNSALSTITTKLNKYPETGTTGKFIKGSSGNYVEGDVDWAEIQNKPTTFTPSAHTHPISDVTNLQSTLDTKENKLNTYQSISSISGVLTLDFNISKNWRIVLTENITLMIINNLPDGGEMNLQLTQNATAPYYTVVLPSLTKVSNYGTGTILMSNFNSAIDYVAFKKVNSVLFADHFPAYN